MSHKSASVTLPRFILTHSLSILTTGYGLNGLGKQGHQLFLTLLTLFIVTHFIYIYYPTSHHHRTDQILSSFLNLFPSSRKYKSSRWIALLRKYK